MSSKFWISLTRADSENIIIAASCLFDTFTDTRKATKYGDLDVYGMHKVVKTIYNNKNEIKRFAASRGRTCDLGLIRPTL